MTPYARETERYRTLFGKRAPVGTSLQALRIMNDRETTRRVKMTEAAAIADEEPDYVANPAPAPASPITIDDLDKIVQTETLAAIGVACRLTGLCMADLEHYKQIAEVRLSPAMCGPVGQMFSAITVKVEVGFARRRLFIVYKYDYDHVHGGRNGYRVEREYPIED